VSALSSSTHASNRRAAGGLAIVGITTALTACGSLGTPAGSSSTTRSGVVTTVPGGETCAGRTGQNDASPDFYRQQYATGLAKQLKDKLSAYDSAVESGNSQHIGDAAYALSTEIRDDARLVKIPRLFGCYDQTVLTRLQNATDAFATTLDTLSCTGVNVCHSDKAEVPRLAARANPNERTYVEAINTYAAQFGGEQLPLPKAMAGFRMRI
jgi:hypothetical protein